DRAARTRARLEAPAVIGALHLPPVETSVGKGDAAMRAGVAQREGGAVGLSSEKKGQAEEQCLRRARASHRVAAQRRIPIAVEPAAVGLRSLACRARRVLGGHGAILVRAGWRFPMGAT